MKKIIKEMLPEVTEYDIVHSGVIALYKGSGFGSSKVGMLCIDRGSGYMIKWANGQETIVYSSISELISKVNDIEFYLLTS